MTSRLYWIGLYEDSNEWKSFFQVDLAPAFDYCAKRMLGECEHTYITGCVALVLTNGLTVLSMFTFDRLVVYSLLDPLAFLFLFYTTDRCFHVSPDLPMVFWFTFGVITSVIVELIWLGIRHRFVCAIASSLGMT